MNVKGPRLTLLASAAALLVVTVFFVANAPKAGRDAPAMADPKPVETREDPMRAFRTERTVIREIEMAQLNNIISSEFSGEEMRMAAERQLMELCDFMEKEVTIEGVLRLRGYADALATVHRDSVNIIIRADEIKKEDTAILLSLAMQETGVSGGNIKIIPIN